MNRVVKQNNGSNVIIGIEGNKQFHKEWGTLIHNYSISEHEYHVSDKFFYFITSPKKFVDGYSLFILLQYFKRGVPAEDLEDFELLAFEDAEKELENFKQESFYRSCKEICDG